MIQVVLIEAGEGYGIKFIDPYTAQAIDSEVVLMALGAGVAQVHEQREIVKTTFLDQPIQYEAPREWLIKAAKTAEVKPE